MPVSPRVRRDALCGAPFEVHSSPYGRRSADDFGLGRRVDSGCELDFRVQSGLKIAPDSGGLDVSCGVEAMQDVTRSDASRETGKGEKITRKRSEEGRVGQAGVSTCRSRGTN